VVALEVVPLRGRLELNSRDLLTDAGAESSIPAHRRGVRTRVQQHVLRGTSAASLAIKGTSAVSAQTRLGIYREGYHLRLTEVLVIHYPVLCKLLGEDAFRDLARAYRAAQPSRFYSARYFGHRLSAFLAADPTRTSRPC